MQPERAPMKSHTRRKVRIGWFVCWNRALICIAAIWIRGSSVLGSQELVCQSLQSNFVRNLVQSANSFIKRRIYIPLVYSQSEIIQEMKVSNATYSDGIRNSGTANPILIVEIHISSLLKAELPIYSDDPTGIQRAINRFIKENRIKEKAVPMISEAIHKQLANKGMLGRKPQEKERKPLSTINGNVSAAYKSVQKPKAYFPVKEKTGGKSHEKCKKESSENKENYIHRSKQKRAYSKRSLNSSGAKKKVQYSSEKGQGQHSLTMTMNRQGNKHENSNPHNHIINISIPKPMKQNDERNMSSTSEKVKPQSKEGVQMCRQNTYGSHATESLENWRFSESGSTKEHLAYSSLPSQAPGNQRIPSLFQEFSMSDLEAQMSSQVNEILLQKIVQKREPQLYSLYHSLTKKNPPHLQRVHPDYIDFAQLSEGQLCALQDFFEKMSEKELNELTFVNFKGCLVKYRAQSMIRNLR